MDGQLLLVLLLLLLLGASGPEGQGPGPGEPEEEPPKEEIPEEDGILVLSRRNLGLALREHRTLLVQFCECTGPEGWRTHRGPPGRGGGSTPHPVYPGLVHMRDFPCGHLAPRCAPGAPWKGT